MSESKEEKVEKIKTALETTMFMAYTCGQNNKTISPDRNFKTWFEENKILDSLLRLCDEYTALSSSVDPVNEPLLQMRKVKVLGMELERWTYNGYKGCVADFGVGEDFATLYTIESKIKCKGYATLVLIETKKYYEDQGKKFGGTVALNDVMKHIYKKLNIEEYK